jgi:hypothetical protein
LIKGDLEGFSAAQHAFDETLTLEVPRLVFALIIPDCSVISDGCQFALVPQPRKDFSIRKGQGEQPDK